MWPSLPWVPRYTQFVDPWLRERLGVEVIVNDFLWPLSRDEGYLKTKIGSQLK